MSDGQLSLADIGLPRDGTPKPGTERATAVSLFASAGIGELGIEAAGIEILVANELIENRVALYRENFPDNHMVLGDIWQQKSSIVKEARARLNGESLFLLYATPPCQGMSTNGGGKLRSEVSAGRRGAEDARNRLIIPTVEIIEQLQPEFVLMENVPGMAKTVIRNDQDKHESLLDFVERKLGSEYVGRAEVIACEDFGIPQKRKRLITIFSRNTNAQHFYRLNGGSYLSDDMRSTPQTLRQAIGDTPPLEAIPGRNARLDFHPQHRVPVMKERKRWWLENTPEGATAFNNACCNPTCRSQRTPGHREEMRDGSWVAVKETPIYCVDCGALLPRPVVEEPDGSVRALKGFHSAYRRMRWDDTARTITQNFIYEASDNKVHPSQTRVLSVYEAMVLQTIAAYDYTFTIDGKDIGIPRIAEAIGESVPPRLIEMISRQLLEIR